MPIKAINTIDSVVVQVCAFCKKENVISFNNLKLGRVLGEEVYKDDIVLGSCSCGAFEFVRRSWDALPPRPSRADTHRRAVNSLGELLKKGGLVEESLKDQFEKEDSPPDLLPS